MKRILCWAALLLLLTSAPALAAEKQAARKPSRRVTATPRPRRTATPTIRPYVQQTSDVFTPSRTTHCNHENCYWTTKMDITDEKAVWNMLMAPVTVLKGNQKSQVLLREKPNAKAKAVGEVTCQSQGVHVLSGDQKGWTKIACYSSSFHGSKLEQWNQLVEGYVETKLLTTVKPNQEMGLVVDKLTQRLYIFRGGKLFTVLRVSTGLPNEKQPYNETRSGEFLFVSRVGTFADGRMVCEKALRFNFGDLIHQVPYNQNENSKDFSPYESKLGTRASHGCIRVQRRRTPEGVNMDWIVSHYQDNTKIVIWEDWGGRQKPAVPADTKVYCQSYGASTYHKSPTCNSVAPKFEPMGAIRFSQLSQSEYARLTPCTYCNPPEK